MATEVLERAKPAARATRSGGHAAPACTARVSGAFKLIIRSLGQRSTRDKLHRVVSDHGYTQDEFEAACELLQQTAVDLVSEPLKTRPPGLSAEAEAKSSREIFDPGAAGERLVEQFKQAEGGAWTGAELQTRFGLTSAVLHRRRKEHRVLYWRDAQHEFHYPRWQFTPTGALLPGLQEVLQTFRSTDEWRLMSYFLGPRRQLDDRRPVDLLREGQVDRVLEHARVCAEENTW